MKFPVQIKGQTVTSINALEFLKNIEKEHHNRAKYHIPNINFGYHYHALISQKNFFLDRKRPFRQIHSDSIIFDFKQDFESYALYNNESISNSLNNRLEELFYLSIAFMQKDEYKDVRNKYNFLLNNSIQCESITVLDIELAYSLLDLFLDNHSIKNDFRNSWNDILILARTINEGGRLISSDKLLNRFASEVASGTIEDSFNFIEIQFPPKEEGVKSKIERLESKGYINRGWQYKIRSGK